MAERETARHTSRRADEVEDVEANDAAARKEKIDIDVDAMLDEIDDVLEENAEEFVKGFVQKGGE